MDQVLVFLPAAMCLFAVVAVLHHLRMRRALSPHRFALAFAVGISLTPLALVFSVLAFVADKRQSTELAVIGVGIALLNFLLGYPFARFLYRFLRPRLER